MMFPSLSVAAGAFDHPPPQIHSDKTDRHLAALMLFALDNHLLTPDECDKGLHDKRWLLSLLSQRLNQHYHRAALHVLGDELLLPSDDVKLLSLSLSLPAALEYDSNCEPGFLLQFDAGVLACYLDLDALPPTIGWPLCLTLFLMQKVVPMMVGPDLLNIDWTLSGLSDELEDIKRIIDLDEACADDLLNHADQFEQASLITISEYLSDDSEAEWLLELLRGLDRGSPDFVSKANSLVIDHDPVSVLNLIEHDLSRLNTACDCGPSLSNHPVVRWMHQAINVMRGWRFGKTGAPSLIPFDFIDEMDISSGLLVPLGAEWEAHVIDQHVDHSYQIGEPPSALLPLDGLANLDAHETLESISEGLALIWSLGRMTDNWLEF